MPQDIRSKFEQDGFVVIENFLYPNEADELREAAYEIEKSCPGDVTSIFSTIEGQKTQSHDVYFQESNDKIRYFFEASENKENEKKALNKVGHAVHWLNPIFKFYTYSDRVKCTCKALKLQDPAVVQSMVIYKSAGTGGEVTPHQDATYLSTEPETAIGFWIALDDATTENGCLWFAAGSHKSGVHRRYIKNPDNNLFEYDKPAQNYAMSNFNPCPVKKGDCILIHGQVLHKSDRNNSTKDRPVYTFHVVEKTAKFSEKNWIQEGPEAPFVSLYSTSQD